MAPTEPSLLRRLRRLRLATDVTLWVERAVVALWPAAGVLGGFACLALLGLPQRVPGSLHAALLLAVGATLAWLLWRDWRGLRWPAPGLADRRLERQAGLTHRPLAVLRDRPATAASADSLWRLHQARALARVASLRLGWPTPALPARDQRALRLLLLLGLTIAVAIAGPDAADRLLEALRPRFAPSVPPIALEVRAWVAPPAYTGLPPSLWPKGGAVVVPEGARVTISLSGGGGGAPSLSSDGLSASGSARRFEPIGGDSFQASVAPAHSGPIAVLRDGAEVARWDVSVRPDIAPVVGWAAAPGVVRGRLPRVRLAWTASHAYGVVALAAELRLRARPDAPPLLVPIPLTGQPREARGAVQPDLTAHPWAGLPVTAILSGRDGAGLVGRGASADLVLPARKFRHPGAQALVAVRRMLSLDPQDRRAAASALRESAAKPSLWPDADETAATVRSIAGLLDDAHSATIEQAQARLWELALRLEEGTPQRTAEALRRAQQELRAALDPAARPETRDKAEIERRAEALAKAMQRQAQALAEQAARDPTSATPLTPTQQQAAQQTLDRLRDAAKGDRMDEARQRMAELDQMLNEMRQAGRSQGQKQRDAGREKGRQQMSVVQDLVQRQAGQIDHAEQRLADPQAGPPANAARDHDRAVQLALRRALGELMQQHGDLAGQVPKNLGEADAAMRDTASALADARDDAASAAALRAVEALQQGRQAMGRALSRQFGQQPGGQDSPGQDGAPQNGEDAQQDGQGLADGQGRGPGQRSGDGIDGAADDTQADDGQADDGQGGGAAGPPGADGQTRLGHRDPFGRAIRPGGMGNDGGRDTAVPEQMEQARGRAVQEELRRREAQKTRPPQELDYIDRLLKSD